MAAPTSPDGPSPVEVLTQGHVPRLSLSEAAGTTLADVLASTGSGAHGSVLLDADALALDSPGAGGTGAAKNGGPSTGGAAAAADSAGRQRRKSSLTQFAAGFLSPFLHSPASEDAATSSQLHPLAHHAYVQGSDCTLPTIGLHIPIYDAPHSAAPSAGAGAVTCVPHELQDGLAELARYAVRRDITYAHEQLLGLPSSAAKSSSQVKTPAGLVPVGGEVIEEGVGARWYWNVV